MAPCDALLLVPPNASIVRGAVDGQFLPPLGLGYLAAVLEEARYRVVVADMDALRWRRSELAAAVANLQPRVVGISAMVGSYNNGLAAARLVRQHAPAALVIMGGPHATFLPAETLASAEIDLVARFEGELTLLDVLRALDGGRPDWSQVPGLAFRAEGAIRESPARPPVADLDTLPLPARHLLRLEQYRRPGILITGRGCVARCVFCASQALHPTAPYRARAADAVVAEFDDLVHRFKTRDLFVADDTFTAQPGRALDICRRLVDWGRRARWTCEARANTMTPELARALVAAGCHHVFIGVETGNRDIMKLIRKNIRLEEVEYATQIAQAAGLDVTVSFILGFPWDTEATIDETLAFAARLRGLGALAPNAGGSGRGRVTPTYYYLTPLPGAYLYDHADELGLRFLSRNWDRFNMAAPIVETRHLNAAQLRAARLRATGA